MEVLIERCAGLDVHKDVVVACVRVWSSDGERVSQVEEFATYTEDLLALRDWLSAHGVTRVGMEATGVFWKPIFWVLEDDFECWLLNARHMRNVPGRKTDVADAEWIARLVEHGLVRPSFVPPKPVRDLRDLTRFRRTQIEERTRVAQRLDKVLQDAGIKLSSVASDILGKSGRAMLEVLVEGSRNPQALAELAQGQLRKKIPDLQRALVGRFSDHHGLLVSEVLAHLDFLDESINRLSVQIDRVIAPFAWARERLITIPGVDKRSAEAILGEIGADMSRFPTPGHLASWAGMCPGQHESAGKSRKGDSRPANSWLQRHLATAAMAAARTKGSYLSAQYHRLAGRRGKKRARKAVGHSILVAIWHMLTHNVDYHDLGEDYFDRRNSAEHRARRKISELRSLGWAVTTNEDGTTTLTPPAEEEAA